MKYFFKIILVTLSFVVINKNNFAQAKISELSHKQIDSLLTEVSKQNLTITQRISFYSELFLKMPYSLTCTGDGADALYENWKLINFDTTNCMVFCEHVLALSISDSWDNFFNNLQQIRYNGGIIGMRTRNHYTMADWLPENNWLLFDATKTIGGDKIKSVTRKISHKDFFTKKGIKDLRYVKPNRKITVNYIPFKALHKATEKMKNGDIFALIFKKLGNIFSGHMLMIIEKEGKKFVRESALSKKTVFDTPLKEWIDSFQNSKKYCGVSFMRLKDELNTKGKIILPWEIPELKK